MLLWWETRGCVSSIPSSPAGGYHQDSLSSSEPPLKHRHFGWRAFRWITVRCVGIAKIRCSSLPCSLMCWEGAVSLGTPWLSWSSQSIQQPKKSGSEMNRCPLFSLSAPGHSLPVGEFGERSSNLSTWSCLALPGLHWTLVASPGLILTPTHRGSAPRRFPMSQAGAAPWLPAQGGVGSPPAPTHLSAAQLFAHFSFSRLLRDSCTKKRVRYSASWARGSWGAQHCMTRAASILFALQAVSWYECLKPRGIVLQ